MTAYVIRLSGCDDSTEFGIDLTGAEAALLKRVAELSDQVSQFACQPTLTIREGKPEADEY